MLPCVDEHFPGPLAPEGTEEQLPSWGLSSRFPSAGGKQALNI